MYCIIFILFHPIFSILYPLAFIIKRINDINNENLTANTFINYRAMCFILHLYMYPLHFIHLYNSLHIRPYNVFLRKSFRRRKPRFLTILVHYPQVRIPRRNVAVAAEKFGRARKAGVTTLVAWRRFSRPWINVRTRTRGEG